MEEKVTRAGENNNKKLGSNKQIKMNNKHRLRSSLDDNVGIFSFFRETFANKPSILKDFNSKFKSAFDHPPQGETSTERIEQKKSSKGSKIAFSD